MPRDPLSTLIRLRQRALDDAQRTLVDCIAGEARARAVADETERAIARETEAASSTTGSDAVVDAFAAWLPGARLRVEAAHRDLESLQAETTRARAGVAACRTALESVETLQRERREKAEQARERRLQLELDDRRSVADTDE